MRSESFEIVRSIGTISEQKKGSKQLNFVRWNGREARYDIRNWSKEGDPYKGITLDRDEARQLLRLLSAELNGEDGQC